MIQFWTTSVRFPPMSLLSSTDYFLPIKERVTQFPSQKPTRLAGLYLLPSHLFPVPSAFTFAPRSGNRAPSTPLTQITARVSSSQPQSRARFSAFIGSIGRTTAPLRLRRATSSRRRQLVSGGDSKSPTPAPDPEDPTAQLSVTDEFGAFSQTATGNPPDRPAS